ncbi:hypothetical protein E2C01_017119 [Portunus trituberculatus]|uniref:Uncharacterized protein n=1 Tax=Portunus trituberculatus TaxID=210409 RepID=A0A5B7DSK8_PORTR|nr:hypothetical protein [Portunus trituberculatus]
MTAWWAYHREANRWECISYLGPGGWTASGKGRHEALHMVSVATPQLFGAAGAGKQDAPRKAGREASYVQ